MEKNSAMQASAISSYDVGECIMLFWAGGWEVETFFENIQKKKAL